MKKVVISAAFAFLCSGTWAQSIEVDQKPENKIEIQATQPLFILDEKEVDREEVKQQLQPDKIESITVIKDQQAIDLYGDKGRNGVIVILTKRYQPAVNYQQMFPLSQTR